MFKCGCWGFSRDRAAWEWVWADLGEDCGTSDPDRNKLNFDALLIIVVKRCTNKHYGSNQFYSVSLLHTAFLPPEFPARTKIVVPKDSPHSHTLTKPEAASHELWQIRTLAKCSLATFHTCVCRVLRHCQTATSGFNLIHQYLRAVADSGELLICLYFWTS